MLRMLKYVLALTAALSLPVSALAQVPVFGPFFYKNITTDATTVVKAGPGLLHTININTPVATGTITIYDGLNASGTKIGTYTIASSPSPSSVTYDVSFGVGLTIVTGTEAMDITVSFR